MSGQGVKKKSKVIPDTRPCFFKIILPGGSNTDHLRIPPDFIKHIAKDAFDIATLIGPSGVCWRVKLCKNVGGFYMQDGWQEFLKAHSLGNHEFLLFAYDGKMCFSIRIYDKSGLERVNVSVSQEHQEHDSVTDCSLHSNQPMSSKHGPGQDLEQFHKSSKLRKSRKEDCSGVQVIYLPDDEEMGFRVENGERVKNRKILKDGRSVPIQKMRSTPKYSVSGSVPPTEARHQVCNRAESFESRFPYFERCLALFNVEKTFVLNIPTAFARTNFPCGKTKMTLRNSKGESWEVNFLPDRGNSTFCGGWRAFVRDNNLRQGDVCIFELVGKTEMQVHIF